MLVNEEEMRKIAGNYNWMFNNPESNYDIVWGFKDCSDVIISALKQASAKANEEDAKRFEDAISLILKIEDDVFKIFLPKK